MTTEEFKNKESKKIMELNKVQKCNEALMILALNGYINWWQYKRINKKNK